MNLIDVLKYKEVMFQDTKRYCSSEQIFNLF